MKHWISCKAFTVQVVTDESGRITAAAPIVRRFRGQTLEALLRWARSLGEFEHRTMEP